MARVPQIAPQRRSVILKKFYVYDPGVNAGDEVGGLRVREEDDGKGKHVLGAPQMMQWWLDTGLVGEQPLGEISDNHKQLLQQVTRGRSESDDEPKRLPKYSKAMQSGAPGFALSQQQPSVVRAKNRRKSRAQDSKKVNNKPDPKKPEPKKPEAPIVASNV